MRDILEGTVQLHLKWLLCYLVLEEKMFSLSTLNGRVQSFNNGPADSLNKPTPIGYDTLSSVKRNNVKQSCTYVRFNDNYILYLASQAWCF